MNLFDITGKKAIVTGGTRGLGYSMAEGYMESGCEVAIIGSSDTVYDVAKEFQGKGYTCYGVKADLAQREQVYGAFEECLEQLGGLDILLTAHGIQRRNPSEDFLLSDWDDVINVNLSSVFVLCQEAAKTMIEQGRGGKIINIASMISFFGGQTIPAYAASKGGVAQLTKALSNDLVAKGINVNAIAPGYMATEMNTALLDPSNPRYETITERIPAHRWGNGDDMKGAAIFLAAPASDYVTGTILPVDGGYLVK